MQKHLVRHNQHHGFEIDAPAKLPLIQLEIVRGAAQHRTRPIGVPTFLVGTAEDCDMVLGDPQFAEVHFYILRNERAVSIRHLGSLPDVTLNGKPIHTAELKDDDRIRSGPYQWRVRIRWPKLKDNSDSSSRDSKIQGRNSVGPSPLQLAEHLLSDIRNQILKNDSPLKIYSAEMNLKKHEETRHAS